MQRVASSSETGWSLQYYAARIYIIYIRYDGGCKEKKSNVNHGHDAYYTYYLNDVLTLFRFSIIFLFFFISLLQRPSPTAPTEVLLQRARKTTAPAAAAGRRATGKPEHGAV